MKKIAILNEGNPYNRKGLFNNVQERIIHLKAAGTFHVDAYLVQHYGDVFFKLLRKNNYKIEKSSMVDDVEYNNLWVKHKLIDYIFTYILKLQGLSGLSQYLQFKYLFKDYDILLPHSLSSMYLAYLVKQQYGIPYVATWHGSDINVWPFKNKKGFDLTKNIIQNADYNFFVSKKLQDTSNKIALSSNKGHLYTGPSDKFYIQPIHKKEILRTNYGITSKYLIGFIGNLAPIKNVLILPDIFAKICQELKDVSFIIVGNGKLFNKLKKKMNEKDVENVLYTGKMNPEDIPDIMNMLDVLLLPSRNEGMPRVILEAVLSGVNVVASDVGGIPEVIGRDNTFPLNSDFVSNVAKRVVEILSSGEKVVPLSEEFSWDYAVNKEINLYNRILNQ